MHVAIEAFNKVVHKLKTYPHKISDLNKLISLIAKNVADEWPLDYREREYNQQEVVGVGVNTLYSFLFDEYDLFIGTSTPFYEEQNTIIVASVSKKVKRKRLRIRKAVFTYDAEQETIRTCEIADPEKED